MHTHIQTHQNNHTVFLPLLYIRCIDTAPHQLLKVQHFIFHSSHTSYHHLQHCVAICTLQIASTFLWFFGMESKKKGCFAPPMAFQPPVYTWFLSCGSIYVTPCQEWLLGQKAHKSRRHDQLGPHLLFLAYKCLSLCSRSLHQKKVTMAFDERNTVLRQSM